MFELFDPQSDYRVTAGNLPHWYQPGVTYFVTIRTNDSIPKTVGAFWHRKRADWLNRHGINPSTADWKSALESLPRNHQREFHDRFSAQFLQYLDRGYGECLFKDREFSLLVAKSLLHFDDQRYRMGDFVVMPNHVHLLVCLLGETDIEKQCTSWKRYTAREINQRRRNSGRFWQEESFDHMVRSLDQFEAIQRYIANNPREAGLTGTQFLHYRYGDEETKSRILDS